MKIRRLRNRWKSVWPCWEIKRGRGKVWWFLVEGECPITYDEIDHDCMLRWK